MSYPKWEVGRSGVPDQPATSNRIQVKPIFFTLEPHHIPIYTNTHTLLRSKPAAKIYIFLLLHHVHRMLYTILKSDQLPPPPYAEKFVFPNLRTSTTWPLIFPYTYEYAHLHTSTYSQIPPFSDFSYPNLSKQIKIQFPHSIDYILFLFYTQSRTGMTLSSFYSQ